MLGAIWGSSFLFMRIAAKDFGPLPLVEVRLLAGVVILLPFLWRARARITRAHWPRFALIGALNSAIPFALFAWGAERAPAGIGAIANSMTALFAALVAFVVFGERIGTRRAIALVRRLHRRRHSRQRPHRRRERHRRRDRRHGRIALLRIRVESHAALARRSAAGRRRRRHAELRDADGAAARDRDLACDADSRRRRGSPRRCSACSARASRIVCSSA